jgi:hypothetical protein
MKTRNRHPTVRLAALLALIFSILSWPARAQFTLASLNCLRLASPQTQVGKYQGLKNFFETANPNAPYGVIVLQEVMRNADLGALAPDPPGTYVYNFTEPPLGPGTYKERYAFLVLDNGSLNANLNNLVTTTVQGFSRPPTGIAIRETNGNRCTWVVNYHAVFGRRVQQRLAEAALMPLVFQQFAQAVPNCQRIVIAGDWNLPAASISQQAHINNIQPNIRTSLKRNGDLSEPYDHFVAANGVNLNNVQVSGVQNAQERREWRDNISDHLPITCEVD